MNIDYGPEIKTADGTFNPKTSEILILETLKDKELEVVLRHELTHALSLIEIKINDIKVNIKSLNVSTAKGDSNVYQYNKKMKHDRFLKWVP